VRLLDRLIRRGGYWEGMASGAAVMTTSYGSPDREAVLPQFSAWAQKAHAGNSVVFSAFLLRMALFSEARLCFQALDDKHLFGNTDLGLLEHPWGPDSTTGALLARMEQDSGLTGNAYIWAPSGENRLVRLRPDWVTIISELILVENGTARPGYYRNKIGYWFEPPKAVTDQGEGYFVHADEVCHWAPIPDPQADFRGMSWLTPIVREVAGDDGLTQYKIRYLENSASPNLLIKYAAKLQDGTVDKIRERMAARHGGVDNAFKTLVLDQGADVTVIGNSLAQMDFSNVASAGTDRILAASMVPGVLVGLEPLRGAGKGYQESMHKLADLWARPQWRSVCGALGQLITVPAGNRLWFDTADIAALQDGALQRGQTALVNMQAVLTARQAGYSRESIPVAVTSGDITKLVPDPGALPPANQPVQHMLPQGQPGATATPLPAGTQTRLPTGSVSPGDGGNGTRPTPQLAAGRRSVDLGGPASDGDQMCPACGARNGPDALYCSQCGAELPDDDGEPDDGLDMGDMGMARFNTNHGAPGSGHGGQFVAAGGGGGAKNGTKPTGGTKTAPAPAGHGHSVAEQKAALHAQAAEDRAKARQLEHELHVLEHQHNLAHSAAVKAAAQAKAAGAGKHVAHHAAHHRKARRKTHRVHSLKARIASLKHRIATLRKQANDLDARAAKLHG
jgi:Phage portal protein/zinc-ribbon domain